MIRQTTIGVALAILLTASGGILLAQESTERYIPIGESPGVSGVQSVIGTIESVDYDAGTMIVVSDGQAETVSIDAQTRYYLDRSARRLTNGIGSFRDCRAGRRVEVKFTDDGSTEWVKIAASP